MLLLQEWKVTSFFLKTKTLQLQIIRIGEDMNKSMVLLNKYSH